MIRILIGLLACCAVYASAVHVDFWLLHNGAILNTMPDWLNRDSLAWIGVYASVATAILALWCLRLDRASRRSVTIMIGALALLLITMDCCLRCMYMAHRHANRT